MPAHNLSEKPVPTFRIVLYGPPMILDNLQPILLFSISAAFTPGPNNLMVTSSGANFGYLRSLPHVMGVTIGFPVMFLALGFGLMGLFEMWPVLHIILRYAGALYMLYLAYRIATSSSIGKAKGKGRPLRFLEAALFQWINPKAVIFALSALSTFTTPGGDFLRETFMLAGISVMISFASISTWCLFGMAIGRLLKTPAALHIFNITMALALVASIGLVLRP